MRQQGGQKWSKMQHGVRAYSLTGLKIQQNAIRGSGVLLKSTGRVVPQYEQPQHRAEDHSRKFRQGEDQTIPESNIIVENQGDHSVHEKANYFSDGYSCGEPVTEYEYICSPEREYPGWNGPPIAFQQLWTSRESGPRTKSEQGVMSAAPDRRKRARAESEHTPGGVRPRTHRGVITEERLRLISARRSLSRCAH